MSKYICGFFIGHIFYKYKLYAEQQALNFKADSQRNPFTKSPSGDLGVKDCSKWQGRISQKHCQ
jgi:hypothetical protein